MSPAKCSFPSPLRKLPRLSAGSPNARECVTLVVPREGEEAKLVRLAETNAKFLLDELKLQRLKRRK